MEYYYGTSESTSLQHYGIKTRSGRYKWGSGNRPFQRLNKKDLYSSRDPFLLDLDYPDHRDLVFRSPISPKAKIKFIKMNKDKFRYDEYKEIRKEYAKQIAVFAAELAGTTLITVASGYATKKLLGDTFKFIPRANNDISLTKSQASSIEKIYDVFFGIKEVEPKQQEQLMEYGRELYSFYLEEMNRK